MLKFRYWKTWDITTENQISADSDTLIKALGILQISLNIRTFQGPLKV
jgi:hypothetical protein